MKAKHQKGTRSYLMSRICGKDTKPELLVRKFLFSKGLIYRLHDKSLPGKPDIVFAKLKTAIFIHGCFWHSHEGCRISHLPKTNQDYWQAKLARNLYRDKSNRKKIEDSGWETIILWECQLKITNREETLNKLLSTLLNKIKI